MALKLYVEELGIPTAIHNLGGAVEIVLGPSLGPIMFKAQLLMMDMLMMESTRGRQRDENDCR